MITAGSLEGPTESNTSAMIWRTGIVVMSNAITNDLFRISMNAAGS
jgi:hypothetical protein